MPLLISETFIDRKQNARYGDSEPYEPIHSDSLPRLFRFLQREYGRCNGKVYIDVTDPTDGKEQTKAIGWVFIKNVPYEDSPKETYLREVWVTLHDAPPERFIKYNYHHIGE